MKTMKKFLPIMLCGLFAATAHAQSNVTIYGIVDQGLVIERGGAAGGATKLTGAASQSRLGFRGTENLGGGMTAFFDLETGFSPDTGTQLGNLFGRTAQVGLRGGFGAVTMGRMYTLQVLALGSADPFVFGMGTSDNVFANTGRRTNNAIKYSSPKLGGLVAEGMVALGEVAGNSAAGRAHGARLSYSAGPLNVSAAHHNRNNDTATVRGTQDARNSIVAANYRFGAAVGYFAYGVNKGPGSSPYASPNPYGAAVAPVASTDSTDLLLGVSVPAGTGTVLASWIHRDDKRAINHDADQWALGYVHPLSKRTHLYTSYTFINNDNGAAFMVGNATEIGSGDKAYNVGIRHFF